MRAVKLVGTQEIAVEEAPSPQLSRDTDALVRVTHTAICGADLLPYHGYTPGFELGTTLGHEFVGVVEDAGDGLAALRPGQRVVNTSMTSDGTCAHCRSGRPTQCESRALFGYSGVYPRLDGGQADLVRIPRADRCLWPVPDDVSDEDAVFVADILPTGFVAVERAGLKMGDVAVVLGCGPVGLMAVMCAHLFGPARVFAIDMVDSRLEMAGDLGAVPVDSRVTNAQAELQRQTGGLGADVVLECVGQLGAIGTAIDCVRGGGTISSVGVPSELTGDFPYYDMWNRDLTYRSGFTNVHAYLRPLLDLVASRRLRPDRIISHRMRLDEAVAAYGMFDRREATKIVLRP